MDKYDPGEIESKWQKRWKESGCYRTSENQDKPKCYVLDMFPYPSGEGLHVGHPKGYIATDIYSRMKRMQGHNVLHPMGWDAFGLPAENYAIKNKVHPRAAVKKNITRFKEQLARIGFNYDWEREINTTDPAYYRWTQWIFLKLFEKGLAYQSYEPINWCPTCQTGLANEDLERGKCERCGTPVVKKPMRQWVLKITAYADRLLEDLEQLDWPESIKDSQRNWIGKSEGAEIEFPLVGIAEEGENARTITVFTTRPDTLFGATYIAISAELAKHWIDAGWDANEKIRVFVDKTLKAEAARSFDEIPEKEGVFTGLYATNPANMERIPVWIANYVLSGYGTGAIMAVPAHDERDFEFAVKYEIPIKEVIMPTIVDHINPPHPNKPYKMRRNVHAIVYDPKRKKYLTLRSDEFGWNTVIIGGIEEGEDPVTAARREVEEETGFVDLEFKRILGAPVQATYFAKHKDENRIAIATAVLFELKSDKRVSLHKDDDGKNEIVWCDAKEFVPGVMVNSELPFWLERLKYPGGVPFSGEGVLINSKTFTGMKSIEARSAITRHVGGKLAKQYRIKDWIFSRQRYWGEPIPIVHCEKDGVVPVPEHDLPVTLPDVESYAPTGTGESPLADITEWVQTTCPKCGGQAKRETNTMPQWAGSSWYYLRYIDPTNDRALVDPAKERYWSPVDCYVGGAEHATRHLIYARFWHKFLYDIGVVAYPEPFLRLKHVGLIMAADGRKMSKRYGNVINPDDIVEMFGADALRVYEMFMGPFDQAIAWSTDNLVGARRFLERVWRVARVEHRKSENPAITTLYHQTIKKVTEDIEAFKFNTAIAQLMIFLNAVEKEQTMPREHLEGFLKVLAPFAPHITEEIWWSVLGHHTSIHEAPWPAYDPAQIVADEITITVQVNGKLRDTFTVVNGATDNEVKAAALMRPAVQKWLDHREPKKIIYVAGKLVSIVV